MGLPKPIITNCCYYSMSIVAWQTKPSVWFERNLKCYDQSGILTNPIQDEASAFCPSQGKVSAFRSI